MDWSIYYWGVGIFCALLVMGLGTFLFVKKRDAIGTWWYTMWAGKDRVTQLYFREDNKFVFRKLNIIDTFLVKMRDGIPFEAWYLAYALQLQCQGTKNVKPDNVSLCYARDIIYDPWDSLSVSNKPDKSGATDKPWVKRIAESQGYTAQQDSSKKLSMSTMMGFIGGAVLLMAAVLAVVILTQL